MHIRVTCPNASCGETFKVKEAVAGQKIKCPSCDVRLVIPRRKGAAEEPDEDEDRGEPVRRKRRGEREPDQSPWAWVALVGGSLFVLVGCAIGLILVVKGGKSAEKVAEVDPPSAPAPKPQPPILLPTNPPWNPGNAVVKGQPQPQPLQPEPGKDKEKDRGKDKEKAPAKFDFEPLKASIPFVRGKRGHGSGFVVLPGVVATNAHVIQDEFLKDVTIRFIDKKGSEKISKVKLLYEDKARDLALLQMETDLKSAPLPVNAGFEAEPGKEVTVIGNPAQGVAGMSSVNAVGKGAVAQYVTLNSKAFIHIVVPPRGDGITVGPGNSGGPVFDKDGAVIGVLSQGLTQNGRPLPHCFCIPAVDVKAAMDGLGSPSEYADLSAKVTAKHNLDIAIVQLFINAKTAKRVLELREELVLTGGSREEDSKLIDSYRKIDKPSAELAQPAITAVLSDKHLPAEVTKDLGAMNKNVETIRKIIVKAKVGKAEHKLIVQAVEQNDKLFEKLKDNSGLTDEVLNEMVKAYIFAVIKKVIN